MSVRPDEGNQAGFMDELKYYTEERDKLLKFTLYSSGLGLLFAAASRIPTTEVSPGVAWLVGTFNVGFLSILAPIFIFGMFLHALHRRAIVADLRRALFDDKRVVDSFGRAALDDIAPERKWPARRRKVLRRGFDCWLLAVPIVAYTILLCSYFDLTRPKHPGASESMYTSRGCQIADLLFGIGGWCGFPALAPSIHDNLERMAKEQSDPKDAARLSRLAKQGPWIYPPFQTWAYLAGLVFMLWAAAGAWREGRT